MANRRILILGGYGSTGRPLTELLLQHTDAHLILAGRNRYKADEFAIALNGRYPGRRVSTIYADASKPETLTTAFQGVDVVVVASSTAQFVHNVAEAALVARIDYLDCQYAVEKTAVLQSLAPQIEQAGCCFVTDGGFHPGLPAALVRYVAPQFDQLISANIGSVIKIDWKALRLSPETMAEFVGEFIDFQMLAFQEGEWQNASLWAMMKPATMDFGKPFGRQYAIPMFLEEMRLIPQMFPTLQETGFFVGGFNLITDWVISPIIMAGLKITPQHGRPLLGRLMFWSLQTFSKPPYGTILKLEARGIKNGKPHWQDVFVAHQDGYMVTAVPLAACLLQMLDGTARRTGLHFQAHLVDPRRLLHDMARMGVHITIAP